ncbi:hypothetical protein SCLCIDRAFT_1215133 [Scleroderma citrinum Foug A]|uniref:Uncharacterized protein n=1 Tax=Scleroderma citrinum Foug A TaxID=1036808 RepID=A0A0C3DPH4_9AGAM|nr:hypothetical protein SCLCIDRAFT_1215133 [Scleroderma citrinum Foug A]
MNAVGCWSWWNGVLCSDSDLFVPTYTKSYSQVSESPIPRRSREVLEQAIRRS